MKTHYDKGSLKLRKLNQYKKWVINNSNKDYSSIRDLCKKQQTRLLLKLN